LWCQQKSWLKQNRLESSVTRKVGKSLESLLSITSVADGSASAAVAPYFHEAAASGEGALVAAARSDPGVVAAIATWRARLEEGFRDDDSWSDGCVRRAHDHSAQTSSAAAVVARKTEAAAAVERKTEEVAAAERKTEAAVAAERKTEEAAAAATHKRPDCQSIRLVPACGAGVPALP
jgi:hypothetical protein